MKLTYRDKVILIGLAVIAVWAIGIMYFIRPKFNDLDTANKDYDAVVVKRDKKAAEVKQDANLKQDVEDALKEVKETSSKFYAKMDSEEVAKTIDELLDADNITNTNLSISAYSAVTLAYIVSDPKTTDTELDRIAGTSNEQTVIEGDKGPVEVPAYSISFDFNCKFDDLQKFVDKLPTNARQSLVVTTCAIDDVTGQNVADEEARKAAQEEGAEGEAEKPAESEAKNAEEAAEKGDKISGNMTMVLMMMPELNENSPIPQANDSADASAKK